MTRLPWTLVVLAALAVWPQKLPAQEQSLDQQLYRHAWSGKAEEVARLLQAGANPNSTIQGMRPLHKAATEGHAKVLRLLIDQGAEVNVKDSSGRSPLLEAAGSRNPQAVALLLAAGAKPDGSELGHACWLHRTEAVDLLLAAGAPPDGGLAQAAQGGHADLVKLLLDRGAKVSAPWKDGHTPLHLAALQGGYKTVELLLARGADVNAVNQDGNTPLHMAVSGDCKLETIKLLVESGAKLNIANNEGRTPVLLASFHGDKTVYRWLLAAAGGKEPIPERTPAERQRQAAKSTETLISEMLITPLNEAGRQERRAAQWELLSRGKTVMPAVLAAADSGIAIENFYGLFRALGPEAAAALPKLEPLLSDPARVQIGLHLMSMIHGKPVAELPLASRQRAAETLNASSWEGERSEDFDGSLMTLVDLGEMAVPYILKLLRSENHYRRSVAAESLRSVSYHNQEITAELTRLALHDPVNSVREAAIGALATVGQPADEVKSVLLSIVKQAPPFPRSNDPQEIQRDAADRHVQFVAAINLKRFGTSIIDELIPLLTPLDAPARFPALEAIQRIGAPAVPRMIGLLDHHDPAIAISARVILDKIGPPAVPALAEAVSTGSPQAAEHAASALGQIHGGAKAALPTLYEVVQSDSRPDAVRLSVARAALQIDPAASRQAPEILAAIPLLIRMLDRGSFRQQGQAAEALKDIGPAARDALPSLRKRLELPPADVDTDGRATYYVRNAARDAIAAIEKPPEE